MYGFHIDRSSKTTISKQLQLQIRNKILCDDLKAGERLPSTRLLANDLGISRNILIEVYEQLVAEGYLNSVKGSGTFVVEIGKLNISKQDEIINKNIEKIPKNIDKTISFIAGNTDSKLFSRVIWSNLMKKACLNGQFYQYPYEDLAGCEQLQKAICHYIYRIRGIKCDYRQIVITQGAAGGLDLLARSLKKSENKVIVQDPCVQFVKCIFNDYGYEMVPVEIGDRGIHTEYTQKLVNPDLVYVAPSHQFPLGGSMSIAGRISLLQYALNENAYIIEDDYDCELRYQGEPLQSIQSLAPDQVIYLGSFSKILSPTIRIGYLILPKHLLLKIENHMRECNIWVSPSIQLALAEFLNQKYMDKLIYRAKKLYEKKRIFLMQCIRKTFNETVRIQGENAGLHLILKYYREVSDKDIKALLDEGIEVEPVEEYCMNKGQHNNELVIGYGHLNFEEIEDGVSKMFDVLNQ